MFSFHNLSGATKKVYDYLYDEIISGRLAPGAAISELELSKRLQTSRSPVREATMVLEGQGLIRRYPGRGCSVSDITVQDIDEIFALRSLLEVSALRSSFATADQHLLKELRDDLEALTETDGPDAYYDTDRRLHELIVNNCGNVRLIMILRTLNGQIEQLRRISARQPQRLAASRQEHLDLVDAVLAGDLDLACERLEHHIYNIQTSTRSFYLRMEV